jgi:hypothetical protein
MGVHLRADHLLCLLTFVGRDYNVAFTANMEQIVVRLSSGADDIVLVDGLDDLCAPLMGTAVQDCLLARVLCRDEMAVKNISSYLESQICAGAVLPAQVLGELRSAFSAGTIRSARADCRWTDLGTAVADAKFPQAHLCFRDTANKRH